jgi:hypothetical protein
VANKLLYCSKELKIMKNLKRMPSILCTALLAVAPVAVAEEFSTTPKPETLQEAIRFEKYKVTSAEAQARKDAAEQARASGQTRTQTGTRTAKSTRTSKSTAERKTGQADSSKR